MLMNIFSSPRNLQPPICSDIVFLLQKTIFSAPSLPSRRHLFSGAFTPTFPHGASWSSDDTIVFGQGERGIFRVSADGGAPEVLIEVDSTKGEMAHGPEMLPDGDTLLFTLGSGGSWDEAQIVAQSLSTGERRVLVDAGTDGRYVPTGHWLIRTRERF